MRVFGRQKAQRDEADLPAALLDERLPSPDDIRPSGTVIREGSSGLLAVDEHDRVVGMSSPDGRVVRVGPDGRHHETARRSGEDGAEALRRLVDVYELAWSPSAVDALLMGADYVGDADGLLARAALLGRAPLLADLAAGLATLPGYDHAVAQFPTDWHGFPMCVDVVVTPEQGWRQASTLLDNRVEADLRRLGREVLDSPYSSLAYGESAWRPLLQAERGLADGAWLSSGFPVMAVQVHIEAAVRDLHRASAGVAHEDLESVAGRLADVRRTFRAVVDLVEAVAQADDGLRRLDAAMAGVTPTRPSSREAAAAISASRNELAAQLADRKAVLSKGIVTLNMLLAEQRAVGTEWREEAAARAALAVAGDMLSSLASSTSDLDPASLSTQFDATAMEASGRIARAGRDADQARRARQRAQGTGTQEK